MYQLWRSTKDGEKKTIEGFELSQFVLLEQRYAFLRCRVIDFVCINSQVIYIYTHLYTMYTMLAQQ